jgi:hypothetical protein
MDSTTPAPIAPVQPTGPGQSVPAQQGAQLPTPPDPRDAAANAYMPRTMPTFGASGSKLSAITGALSYSRFHPDTKQPSFYLPCWNLLTLILSQVDRIMINTYRFHQSSPDWHPLVSQVYYSIIFIVHIIRVRQSARTMTQGEADFLSWFEMNFPLSGLPIAGPLKHFFQAITATSGPDKYYGDISPSLPNIHLRQAREYTFGDFHDVVLPPIPVLMDMILDIAAPRQTAFDSDSWNRFYRPLTHVHSAATGTELFAGLPGIADIPMLPANMMPTFYNAAQSIMWPQRLNSAAGNADLTSIAEYLRLATYGNGEFTWFPYVVGMMQRHAQFMKDSTNLVSISTVGLAACLPVVTLSANPHISLANAANNTYVRNHAAVAAVAAQAGPPPVLGTPGHATYWTITRFSQYRLTAVEFSSDLHLIAEQLALLSSINISFTGLAARGNHHRALPTDAQLRQGPYWTRPICGRHSEIDVLSQIVIFLAGTFTVDQRMTK